jgi:hypothetical protein
MINLMEKFIFWCSTTLKESHDTLKKIAMAMITHEQMFNNWN